MKSQNEYVLITFIVNRGYADDAMLAARKAGAKGGPSTRGEPAMRRM
jgi:hypothetical protein